MVIGGVELSNQGVIIALSQHGGPFDEVLNEQEYASFSNSPDILLDLLAQTAQSLNEDDKRRLEEHIIRLYSPNSGLQLMAKSGSFQ